MRFACYCIFLLFAYVNLHAQNAENLVIVTLDGMRWQEVFAGADTALINNNRFTNDKESINYLFGGKTTTERRAKLFPFLWSTLAKQGQLYGNRWLGNYVQNANPYKFSYPGYNELFTGYADSAVSSNDKILNKNVNVLEFINQQNGFENKVAVFATWDVFPYILNKQRSSLFINADSDTSATSNSNLKLINEMQALTSKPIDVRPDIFTYMTAREYMKLYQPRVLYIALDETDDFAHHGMYDQYLRSANAADRMLRDLWQLIQSIPAYSNKTTLIITCDHGRGEGVLWHDHGDEVPNSEQIWVAAIGPNIEPMGECQHQQLIYQKQLAQTFAAILGLDFKANHPIAPYVASMVGNSSNTAKLKQLTFPSSTSNIKLTQAK
jgi:hypothetical protein